MSFLFYSLCESLLFLPFFALQETKSLRRIVAIFLIFISFHTIGQDSLPFEKHRFSYVLAGQAAAYSVSMTGLYQLWYKDYDHSSFHFFDDSEEWLQMDKIGHAFSSYYVNEICYSSFKWVGMENKKNVLLGGGIGLLYITTIEVFDGFSAGWGASVSDFAANTFGMGLFAVQQYYWEEQKIIPKFSFHQTKFSDYRPDLLGKDFFQNLVKDYNGQTYWLSVNMNLILPNQNIPKWLNIAIGYSADGMTGGAENVRIYEDQVIPIYERKRQYYLSLDIDLTKIKTKSKFLNTCFAAFNCLKMPFPAVEYSEGFQFKPLYF